MKDNTYGRGDPLAFVIEFLEKANEDQLASQVIDVFSKVAVDIEQVNMIANLYHSVRDIPKAEKYVLKVIDMASNPQELFNARCNAAKFYNNINEPYKSISFSLLNEIIQPNDPDVKLEMVFSYYLMGEKDKAESILREMKSNENELSERHRDIVNFNLGTYDMEQGKFLEGLGGFLLNVKKLELWFSPKELPYKFWNGGVYPGKTLILFMEGGGIGDEFITVRWMNKLKDMGFNPVYYTTRPDLHKIFNANGYNCVMSLENMPKDSLWTYAMQVPIWLKCKPEEVIVERYLRPSDEARNKWNFLKENKKIKIGVRWQGNSKNERDLHRQVPLDHMMKTLHEVYDGLDVEYYSLQIGDGQEQSNLYPELIDYTNMINSYDDTFALLENLDLVVTSCTSVLHASAIMGTKTMCMIPISAYFTWLSPPTKGRDKNTSIWYGDNVRVFKQILLKNWDKPFDDLKKYLKEELHK